MIYSPDGIFINLVWYNWSKRLQIYWVWWQSDSVNWADKKTYKTSNVSQHTMYTPQGHHFQNLVPASWIPAGTSHFYSISLSRKVHEVLSFSRTTLTICKRSRVAWIAQRKPLHCFYSITGVIINRRSITPKSVRHIFAPLGTSLWQPKLGPSCTVLWIFSTLWYTQ